MSKKKSNVKEKQKQNPPKSKFTTTANIYHNETIAGLEKKYRLAMRTRNYGDAGKIFKELTEARLNHRNLQCKKELVKI